MSGQLTSNLDSERKSDGTSSGTSEIATGVGFTHPVNYDGELYFIASGSLYKSDGTSAGTVNISSAAGIDNTQALAVADGTLFFDADYDGEHSGPYVWYSLTPTSGPQIVSTGYDLNYPQMLTDVNGSLYFDAASETNDDVGVYVMSAVTTTTDLYYSNQQQVLEQRQGGTTTDQYVWSPFYVNDLILRDDNSTTGSLGISGSGLGERLYAQNDANYNVTALVNTDGTVGERFIYDPYGNVTVLNADWSASAATAGEDAYQWTILFQGERYDPQAGVYVADERVYSPTMQRWLQQDPAGYVDGFSRYQLELSNPAIARDPLGLQEDEFPSEEAELEEEAKEQREQREGIVELPNTVTELQKMLRDIIAENARLKGEKPDNNPGMMSNDRDELQRAIQREYDEQFKIINAQRAKQTAAAKNCNDNGGANQGAQKIPELGRKLDYPLGKATGSDHNIARSTDMLHQLESIGLPDSDATRQLLTEHLTQVLNDGTDIVDLQKNGRTVRESLLIGPNGLLKLKTTWEGNKLITILIYGGK